MPKNNYNESAVEQILEDFSSAADLSYRAFSQKLKSSTNLSSILGIRMPMVRKTARALVEYIGYDEAVATILPLAKEWLEYKLLLGLVLSRLTPVGGVADAINILYSLCDGWVATDLFKDVLGQFAEQGFTEEVMDSLQAYKDDSNPFARRLTVVTFLPLVKKGLVDKSLAINHIQYLEADDNYYVEMANAWLLAELTIMYPQIVCDISKPSLLKKYHQKLRDSCRLK